MKAMILAAGMGSRLRPLTDNMPKALVEIDGEPILKRVIEKLINQGFKKIVVNAHHFAGQIKKYLSDNIFDAEIFISDESEELLDTGGGIVKAYPMLYNIDDAPVLIHNVDILSNADLKKLMIESGGNTLLMVSKRDSSRKLIFDRDMRLKGWHDLNRDLLKPTDLEVSPDDEEYAFSGIYVLSKESVLEMRKLMGECKYSVMDYFLHPERKVPIYGKNVENLKLLDIGKPATLSQASKYLKEIENSLV